MEVTLLILKVASWEESLLPCQSSGVRGFSGSVTGFETWRRPAKMWVNVDTAQIGTADMWMPKNGDWMKESERDFSCQKRFATKWATIVWHPTRPHIAGKFPYIKGVCQAARGPSSLVLFKAIEGLITGSRKKQIDPIPNQGFVRVFKEGDGWDYIYNYIYIYSRNAACSRCIQQSCSQRSHVTFLQPMGKAQECLWRAGFIALAP